jgi:hypothetical protein
MKKMIFVLTALLLAAPAMAGLTISCAQKPGELKADLNYVATADANIPRGLGLEITVDKGTITNVENLSSDYWVYPGSIVIDTNDPPSVAQQGTPLASGAGTDTVILEMGSLHWPTENNSVNAPDLTGTLLTIILSSDCNLTITGNGTRGNVVDYDAAELKETEDLVYTGCQILPPCFPACNPYYAEWLSVGAPTSWCNPEQCYGDADGVLNTVKGKTPHWVGAPDLALLSLGWRKPHTDPNFSTYIAADFDRDENTVKGYPPHRCGAPDLTIMTTYWRGPNDGKPAPPSDCLDCP